MAGNSTNTQSQTQSAPWEAQQPYLTDAFQQAQNLYYNNTASGPYTGEYVAAPTQNQYDAYNQANAYGSNTGYGTANSVLGNAATAASTGAGATNSAVSGLTNAGTTNQTGNLVNNAQTIANGFNVNGAVQAAMQSANQEAADNTLPNLYRGAAASGNINSDRTAIAQGVVDRGLAQTDANLSAQLQNSAYGQGLSSAGTQAGQQLSALSALGSLGSANTGLGITGSASGLGDANSAAVLAQGGANGIQNLNQSIDTNALDKFNGTNNYGWTQLQNYLGAVQGNYGTTSSTSGTTQSNPSILSTSGSILGLLGSLI